MLGDLRYSPSPTYSAIDLWPVLPVTVSAWQPYAPVSLRMRISLAVSVPSRLTPVFILMRIGWREREAMNSSSRVYS